VWNKAGRLASDQRPSSVQFVFDGEPLARDVTLALQPSEIAEATWMSRENAVRAYGEAGLPRIAAAMLAHDDGTTAYLTERARWR
jgi:hypothetical protein